MDLEVDLDILCVTETWLKGDPSNDVHIVAVTPPGFQLKHNPRTSSKGGRVGMFYRDVYNVRPQQSHSYKSFEHMSARVVSGSSLYQVFIIYRPPPSVKNKLTFPMFMDEFPQFLADAVLTAGKLLIMGDFNIHMNSENRESEQFKALLDTYNLSQHVSSPTYRRGRISDLVLTRTNDQTLHDLSVTNPLISDHCAVLFSLHTSRPPCPKKTIRFRNFKSWIRRLSRLMFVPQCFSPVLLRHRMNS